MKALLIVLSVLALSSQLQAAEPEDKDVTILKLRLQLNAEKLLNQRHEFNMLLLDRKNICADLAGKDPKTHAEQCVMKEEQK